MKYKLMTPDALKSMLTICLSLFWGLNAFAQNTPLYPNKPIRLVLGYGAGGVADITARLVAQKLSDALGQQVVVDNRPSAGGIVAGEMVAKADPDGYTLLHMNYGNAVSQALFKKLPYDIKKDFVPISAMGFFDVLMLVDKGSDIQSVQDFINKAKANPEKYNIGSVSIGSGQHMSANLFVSMSGLQSTLVPFKTTPSLMMALKSKDVAVAFEIISPAMSLIKSGEIKAIAVSSSNRFKGLSDVPTINESGVKGYDVMAWNGIAAPAKTPKAIIERLNREVNLILNSPEVKQKFLDVGIDSRGGSPEDLRDLLSNEIDKWNNLVNTLKMERM
ncbi:MAG: Bug family tripartite tricarboxylate transporter substrate binding protein [Burkholderiaceae bacterium]